MAMTWEPYFLALVWIDFAVCGFVLLITWRIALSPHCGAASMLRAFFSWLPR
jgi:hypothetical protein